MSDGDRDKQNILSKGWEMMWNPEKWEEDYIKRKGRAPSRSFLVANLVLGWIGFIALWILTFFIPNPVFRPASPGFVILLIFSVPFLLHSSFAIKRIKTIKRLNRIYHQNGYRTVSPSVAVCCPYCNNTFQIPQQNKPFKVKCPSCAKESLFR
ncbi:MAG: hypothetical protein KJ655_06550 [Candidatus Thermoplasmatota archaeon]|nr:hypothetical protein [Candidatus Thermoplasmatota archaeon]